MITVDRSGLVKKNNSGATSAEKKKEQKEKEKEKNHPQNTKSQQTHGYLAQHDFSRAGLLKLQDDVQTCGYEDVQVMWEMLQRTESDVTENQHKRPPFASMAEACFLAAKSKYMSL
ncbi:hypothetical protein DEO72_LG10g22 [Vigna unguiculata]|uniref:Uncharacterized protein n=1 Tax=Vigna unguiculata TaxID=3917 RepID=A0A4D6N7J7_VIGUN|nr:hypothetical protein DEO72_LG10g22 [Vigna unguiculata]